MIIGIETRFDAAHHLPFHQDKCRFLHGHTWHVTVELKGFPDKNGILLDFSTLKAHLTIIIDKLDHKNLNEELVCVPTCENIASHIKGALISKGLDVHAVKVREGEGGYAIA